MARFGGNVKRSERQDIGEWTRLGARAARGLTEASMFSKSPKANVRGASQPRWTEYETDKKIETYKQKKGNRVDPNSLMTW